MIIIEKKVGAPHTFISCLLLTIFLVRLQISLPGRTVTAKTEQQ